MRVFTFSRFSPIALAVAATVSSASALNISWNNSAGGVFSTGTDWVGNIAPGSINGAVFGTGSLAPYTVSFTSSPSNTQLLIGPDNVAFDLNGQSYSLTAVLFTVGNHSVEVGTATGGSLTLENSGAAGAALKSVFASIGVSTGQSGTVTVAGPHVTWTGSENIDVGDGGNGTLSITGGASVSDAEGVIGNASTGSGQVTIDGAGSTWNNSPGYFYIGMSGNATLTIQNGGQATNDVTDVGQYTGSTAVVTVTGAGSKMTNNYLDIGCGGAATFNIQNGASVTDAAASLSIAPTSSSTTTISGANSSWTTSGNLSVGTASAATLNIQGGTVSVGGNLNVGITSQVNLSGGTLRIGALNSVTPLGILGNGLTTGWTGGTLNITNSDLSISSSGMLGSSLTLGAGKTLSLSSSSHTLSIAAGSSLNVAGGSVYASTLNNAGSLSLPAGSSVEAVNPLVNTGLIDVSGGTLQLDNGLSSGSVRTQILAAYDHGDWDGTTGITSTAAENDSTRATALAYITTGSTTKIIYTWYGDADGSGTVTAADAAAISPTGTTWQTGDFNYDGVVNADDFSLFTLGAIYGSGNISTRLPEPTALAVLLPLAGILSRRRR